MSMPSSVIRPAIHVPEPRQQRYQRGLAAARGPHQRHRLAGRHGQRDVVQRPRQRRVSLVAEAHALERDPALHRGRQRHRRRRVVDGGLHLEDLEHPLGCADRLLVRAEGRGQRADRGRDRDGIQQEADQRARREPAVEHQQAALPEHEHDRGEGREGQHAEEDAAHPRALQRQPHARRDPLAVARALGALLHEALHRADLRERLLRHRARLGHPVLHTGRDAPEPPPEDERRADHHRRHEQRGQREPRLQPGEQHDAADQGQHLAAELGDLVAQHALEQADVDGQPAGELAGAPVREEPGRHLQQAAEQVPPEPGHRLLAGRAQEVGLDVVEHRLQGEQAHEAERDAVEQRAVPVHERGVQEVPDRHREGEARHAAQHQRGRGADQQPAIGPDARPEADQAAGLRDAARAVGGVSHGRRRGKSGRDARRHGCTCAAAGMANASAGRPRMITWPAGAERCQGRARSMPIATNSSARYSSE